MAKKEATVQEVSLPAPAARTGPDGLAEHSAPRHIDRTGLRARIGGAPAAHSAEAWRPWPYLQQAPVPTTNAAPYGRHGTTGLTVATVGFFLTMQSGVRWALPPFPWTSLALSQATSIRGRTPRTTNRHRVWNSSTAYNRAAASA